jgi:hypothetical protein
MNIFLNMVYEWLPLVIFVFMVAMIFMYKKNLKKGADYMRKYENMADRTLQIQENILQELKKISKSLQK